MSPSVVGQDIDEVLGVDLLALVRARGVPLTGVTEITGLPSPVRARGAFLLEFADGARLKGRRLRSAERAARVERLQAVIGDGFSRILGRHGAALLLEWVEGRPLGSLPAVPAEVLHRAGGLLGALHARHAGHAAEGPGPSVQDLLDGLARDVDLLRAADLMDAALADDALVAATASRPDSATVGIIHKDYCAANLVLGVDGALVAVDNATLSVGPHDLDLGRAWARWPMSPGDRARFAAGYEAHRPLEPCLRHFAFWASCALVGSAATRLRARARGALASLARLRALLAKGAVAPGDARHPFRVM